MVHSESKDNVVSSSRYTGPYEVSESIYLTPVWGTDTQELYRVLNINKDIANGLYAASIVFPFPMSGAISFTERHKSKRAKNEDLNSWAIRQSVDGPLIGILGVHDMTTEEHSELGPCYKEGKKPQDHSVENIQKDQDLILNCCSIGYWISPEHEGKGIMTRVVTYAADYLAAKELGYERVHAESWEENKASQKVMQNARMSPIRGIPCFVPKFNSMKNIAHYIKDVKKPKNNNNKL
ncbi:hypothetical protein BGZ76_007941, partial [Entomortierella beljakovae]